MADRIAGVGRVLAIASGKGGVGKTTVTVNLALALAQTGARTGIFDADIYGPNIPLMLGVRRQEEARGWLPVARAAKEPYVPPLGRFGLQVMSIGLLVGEAQAVMPHPLFTGRIVTQTIRDVLWDRLDYLLVDLPPGTGEPQQSLLQAVPVDGAVIVTTPQDLSLLDAGRSLAMFHQSRVPILGLVENMSYLYCPHCGERVEVFHHSDRPWAVADTGIEVLGRIPMDLAISRGIATGHPLLAATPDAAEAAVFRDIAARVREKLV